MPTTQEEAKAIIKAAKDYVPAESLYQLFTKLDNKVGQTSENSSVKETMRMLKEEAAQLILDEMNGVGSTVLRIENPALWAFVYLVLVVWVILHFVYIGLMIASFMLLPALAEWYIAAPLMAVPPVLLVSPGPCPLTMIENVLRRRLGMPTIGGFIRHYCIKTVVRVLR
jgi:hypothetical protein